MLLTALGKVLANPQKVFITLIPEWDTGTDTRMDKAIAAFKINELATLKKGQVLLRDFQLKFIAYSGDVGR